MEDVTLSELQDMSESELISLVLDLQGVLHKVRTTYSITDPLLDHILEGNK